MRHHRFNHNESFQNQILYFSPQLILVVWFSVVFGLSGGLLVTITGSELIEIMHSLGSFLLNFSEHPTHKSLVAFRAFVAHEVVFVRLVYCVVCQVHELVFQVPRRRGFVLFHSEAGDAFLVDVRAQWVNAVQQHVDSQVELQVID